MNECPTPDKPTYPTKHHAERAAIRTGRRAHRILFAYRCPTADHWHLTRKLGRVQRTRKP